MSKKIECRLPDELYQELKDFSLRKKLTITDVVVKGVLSIIHPEPENQECHDKPDPEIIVPAASEEADFRPSTTNPLGIRPKKVKGAIKTKAIPIVQALLSGVSRPPIHAHHPACTCGVCRAAKE